MSVRLVWRPAGRSIPLEPGANLLRTLVTHGIQTRFQCMEGHCGACEAQLVRGCALVCEEEEGGGSGQTVRAPCRIRLCVSRGTCIDVELDLPVP